VVATDSRIAHVRDQLCSAVAFLDVVAVSEEDLH
jgi:hypothetical protein